MRSVKQTIASAIGLLALSLFPLVALSEPDEKLPPDGIAYRPEAKTSINSLEVARNNLAELLSVRGGDIPGIRTATTPATCSGISREALHRLGKGGPSHASLACRKDQLLYVIYESIQVLSTGLHASNEVSVKYSDLLGADLSVRQVSASSVGLDLMQTSYPYGEPTPDGRPNPIVAGAHPFRIVLKNGTSFHFGKLENASAFADNLFFIQSVMQVAEEGRTARFETRLAQYRAGVKPAVTEDQRRLLVQANLMTQRKNYAQALDLYQQALDIDPVAYPEAYFNSALLLELMERYAAAIDFMKKYLLLLPNGKDARQAQDKIYEWELLSSMTGKP